MKSAGMTTFDNHPPINFGGAEKIASASRDGGHYSGIGADDYTVFRGKKIHLMHYYTSGCTYNNRTSSNSTYLGNWTTTDELIEWLVARPSDDRWWADELLSDLGYAGEQA